MRGLGLTGEASVVPDKEVNQKREMENKIILGQNIKRYRLFAGLQQKELATETRLSEAMISKLELGKENVTIENLIKIADVLDVNLEELFCREGKQFSIKFVISKQNLRAFDQILKSFQELFNKEDKE